MIFHKTEEEIERLEMSNLLVAKTLGVISKEIAPGISTLRLDKIAEEYIRDNGGKPGFLGYDGFPNTLCVSINSQVVHGIPSSYELKEGDVVSCDCGVLLNGFYGDSAYTFTVGAVTPDVQQLLKVTKEALYKGVEQAIEGNHLGDIGFAIQKHAEQNSVSVVREMVGHGIGKNLHEDPQVPNYGKKGRGLKLREGLVVAIEPMFNLGKKDIYQDSDGWAIVTADGKPSAHFEHTVVVRKGKAQILSSFEFIEDIN
ncbi:type I methionyl aminopeptidase [Labilibaculum sp. A4]|uniref:type I methionyl aminopeptidase n=1 Tax=Labilibaculum euxinus TaxID=2686357 RepID=UPI000F61CE9A|nr:type I methionyl aminopeptidase [Labilibaculum euxinus]MDQ1769732.1 type I methionyl aminopeptidase [Labilibaculum euxinus]MWN76290.1 type I methionyl aminopeptidase [Labilibaculum euxinus]